MYNEKSSSTELSHPPREKWKSGVRASRELSEEGERE